MAKVRNATYYGPKVFMDARWLVTPKEGDRYPYGPPLVICRCSSEEEQTLDKR